MRKPLSQREKYWAIWLTLTVGLGYLLWWGTSGDSWASGMVIGARSIFGFWSFIGLVGGFKIPNKRGQR